MKIKIINNNNNNNNNSNNNNNNNNNVVVGVLGTVKNGMVENVKKVSERATMTVIKKICMLGFARILRKVLSV